MLYEVITRVQMTGIIEIPIRRSLGKQKGGENETIGSVDRRRGSASGGRPGNGVGHGYGDGVGNRISHMQIFRPRDGDALVPGPRSGQCRESYNFV